MEPINEEKAQDVDEGVTLMMDDNNSIGTINRSKFSAVDSH